MGRDKRSQDKLNVQVGWQTPPTNFVKLNTDGSSLGNPGKSGAGGLFRDFHGQWLSGFSRNLGVATIMATELWELRDGLRIAVEKGFNNLIVEVDSYNTLRYVMFNVIDTNTYNGIVADCMALIQKLGNVRLLHRFREANSCADLLANMENELNDDFVLFNTPPNVLNLTCFLIA